MCHQMRIKNRAASSRFQSSGRTEEVCLCYPGTIGMSERASRAKESDRLARYSLCCT